jgi:hypothetical protein
LLELVSRTELPLPATPLRDVALRFACHRGRGMGSIGIGGN